MMGLYDEDFDAPPKRPEPVPEIVEPPAEPQIVTEVMSEEKLQAAYERGRSDGRAEGFASARVGYRQIKAEKEGQILDVLRKIFRDADEARQAMIDAGVCVLAGLLCSSFPELTAKVGFAELEIVLQERVSRLVQGERLSCYCNIRTSERIKEFLINHDVEEVRFVVEERMSDGDIRINGGSFEVKRDVQSLIEGISAFLLAQQKNAA
jgi:flagellar biosynthesis/type III secretory pathway protein FliH